MSEHVIELNGKRYDANTGAQLGSVKVAPVHSKKVIDGFIRQTAPRTIKPAPTPAVEAAKKIVPVKPTPKPEITPITTTTPKPNPVRNRKVHSHAKRQPEHSKTLMRTVRRPQTAIKPAIKTQAPAEALAKPVASTLARKQSVEQVDVRRMEKAIHTPKHDAITRFHHEGTPVLALTSEVPVPIPLIAVRQAPVVTPKAVPARHSKPASHDIFEAAMHRATSHTQPAHKPAKHKLHNRLANTFAGVVAFLVLAGFIGYLNMPALELRVASMQAGFSASMPDYRPTGYALTGGVQRIGGTVSVSFRSGANNYTITQQSSDWNSQTLLDNTLALAGDYQTIQKNGQTIYMYGNGANAAWVNGGVRYDLTGNATLSRDDIANIAASL